MRCKCGHIDLSPTITGNYTLPGKNGGPEIFYGVGYTCKGCGTDGTILAKDATEEQREAADLAELSKDATSEMMMGRR